MFAKGQKIACINASFSPALSKLYTAFPIQDNTYTVRDIVPGIHPSGSPGEVAVYLSEIHNPPNRHGIEPGYNAERFAPLETVTEEREEQTLASFTA